MLYNTVLVDADAVCQQIINKKIKTTICEKDKDKQVLNCHRNI